MITQVLEIFSRLGEMNLSLDEQNYEGAKN
jgi:hypothetical protein